MLEFFKRAAGFSVLYVGLTGVPLVAVFGMTTGLEAVEKAGIKLRPDSPPGFKSYPLIPKPELSKNEIVAGCEIDYVSYATASPFLAQGWERVCAVEPKI